MMVCPYNSPWFLSMDNTKVLKYLFLNTTEILDLYENHWRMCTMFYCSWAASHWVNIKRSTPLPVSNWIDADMYCLGTTWPPTIRVHLPACQYNVFIGVDLKWDLQPMNNVMAQLTTTKVNENKRTQRTTPRIRPVLVVLESSE